MELLEDEKIEKLAILMTKIEKEFNIPMINDKEWNEDHKEIIKLYRKISNARDI